MKPRLKSLELHGYKTFAGRVLFEFPGNITAIVGPNGSGKSNIADALRWVLGEQSYSLLRGKKTEDMIFLGSDQRPRAGMASAMITFDNEDNWLPIDYSDVAIARRAYRDGSNDYMINKQKVRLKDISELLAQSGLAERTYTIIGQGLVDAALSLRPEERRRFFEEAAGIGLFRSRREESLSRLDSTRRNLERVNDILSELEPRLRSLERQAKRAEEYDRVKADLHLLLRDWYGFHWQNTQKELLRNREILKNQEEKVNAARQKRTEIEEKVEAARTRLQELRGLLNQWHSESAAHHTRREKVSRELAVLDERLRSYQSQEVTLGSELDRNEENVLASVDRLATLVQDKGRVEEELQECREQLVKVQELFTARQDERSKLEEAQSRERRKLVEVETRQVQLKAHQRELQGRLEIQTTSQNTLNSSLAALQSELQEAQDKAQHLASEKEKATSDLHKTEDGLKQKRQEISTLEDEERNLLAEKNKFDAEILKQKAQMEVLIQAEVALAGMGEGAKSLLTASRGGKLRGQLDALNSLLDVPLEYEIAIVAALGEQLDAVLVGDDSITENVLEFLQAADSGRAMIIPVSGQSRGETIKLGKIEGVIGVASDLVRAVGGKKGVIDRLLNGVLVVEDRKTARQLVDQVPFWAKVVTLNGEVYGGNGIITAGKEKRTAIISRPRQKQELEEKIAKLLGDQRKVESALMDCREHLSDTNEKRKKLEAELKEQQVELNTASSAFEAVARSVQQLTQKLEWQNSQIDTLAKQQSSTEEEIRSIQAEVEKGASAIAVTNTTMRELNEQLRAIPIDELQTQLVHWNTRLAVSERAVKEADRRVQENEQALSQSNALVAQVKARIEGLKTLAVDAETEKAAQKTEEETANSAIKAAREKIDPAEQELSQLENQYSQLQHEYSQTQQFEANADRVHTQAQLELARSHESMDSLRRRIEEDFGLVSLEYSEDITGPTPLPLEGVGKLVTLTEIPRELEESINRQRAILRRMGAINTEAQKEYHEVKERHDYLASQMSDLKRADEDLRQIINELDELMHKQFRETFNAVAAEFKVLFSRLFGGGSARLIMTDDDNPTETGIDIEARLPGRREQGLSLLSGGERSLTAVALVFSLLKVSPTPFCVMDEVDAMLDEANVGRFTELLKELSQETQFIVITHNRNTVQVADVIYGVTMGRDSASQVISLRLDELDEEMVR